MRLVGGLLENISDAETVTREVHDHGGSAIALQPNPRDVERVFDEAESSLGAVSALVNAAGMPHAERVESFSTPPNIVTAANGGQGEIISDLTPFTFMLDATGKYRSICDNNEQVGIQTFDAYVVQPKFAEAHPQAASAFLRAAYRVNDEVTKEPTKMLGLTQKYLNEVGIKMTPEEVKESFGTMSFPSIDESLTRMKSGDIKRALEQSAKFLVSIGAMEKVPDINFVTPRYLEMAKQPKK